MITKLLPDAEQLAPIVANVRAVLDSRGITDPVGAVIQNMRANAQMKAMQGVDAWLGYGVYLPAVERIIAVHGGEDEADFLARTQYPIQVIEAYTVPGDDLATLVAADQFSLMHQLSVLKNTAEWCLNEDEQLFINLNDFEQRLKM